MHRIVLFVLLLFTGCAGQPAAGPYPTPLPVAEVPGEIDGVLRQAAAEQKLAMLVLGANWCHDSTDFAAMLESPELKPWLEEHYVIALYDQGYLDHIPTYVQPFGVPTMYGTPTVLVIDPQTRGVRNLDSHFYWRNASQLEIVDARRYFEKTLTPPPAAEPPAPELAAALRRIDAFEAAQAERILSAYAALGELMKEGDDGRPPEGFEEKWVSLAKMRGQITEDLAELRRSARQQAEEGLAPVRLSFPTYSLFTD